MKSILKIIKMISVSSIILLASTCQNTDVTLSLDTLKGTYTLIAFTISNSTTYTQDDFSSFSGTMVITSGGYMSQTVTLEDTTVTATGTVEVINDTTLKVTSSYCTYNIEINLSGDILTTTFKKGTCGIDYTEIDVWKKISSTPALSNGDDLMLQELEDIVQIPLGGIAGTFRW